MVVRQKTELSYSIDLRSPPFLTYWGIIVETAGAYVLETYNRRLGNNCELVYQFGAPRLIVDLVQAGF